MNLRSRLNLLVTLVLLVILVISAALAVNTARENVRAEVESMMNFALPMMGSLLNEFNHDKNIDKQSILKELSLTHFRHLHIAFNNSKPVNKNTENQKFDLHAGPEKWFRILMYQSLNDIKSHHFPVIIKGILVGYIEVSPQPDAEITEAWEETKTMLGMVTLFFIVVNVLVYVIVAKALKPITQITSALSEIEIGNLDARLPEFKLPEMDVISQKFNGMAGALETARKENQQLTQQIIQLQEAERKSIAQELHDEIGQHLTAVRVDACAIKRAEELSRAQSSAEAIDHVVEQMIQIIRSMLQRLRPGGLDDLSFLDALHVMMSNWQDRHPNIDFNYKFSGEFVLLPESVQLTLYRVIQESLTNISRHAQAGKVHVELVEEDSNIKLNVTDDGQGFDLANSKVGFGLAGMKERIYGLDGEFDIQTGLSQGVSLKISIPKDEV